MSQQAVSISGPECHIPSILLDHVLKIENRTFKQCKRKYENKILGLSNKKFNLRRQE